MRTLALAIVCLSFAGCSPDGLQLFVEVRTDYRAGLDFRVVRTEVLTGLAAPPQTIAVTAADDFVGGGRVAEFGGIEAGRTVSLRVELLDDASANVASRIVTTPVRTDRAVVVTISTLCRSVVCPGVEDDPEATECLSGRCVPPTCNPDEPESCGEGCASDAECDSMSPCAPGRCVDGECFAIADDSLCSPGESCSGASGCIAAPADGGTDAGRDSGVVDSAVVDSGAVDSGAVDSGVCSGSCTASCPADDCLILGGCDLELYAGRTNRCQCESQCSSFTSNPHRECRFGTERLRDKPLASCQILGGCGLSLFGSTTTSCDCQTRCDDAAVANPYRSCTFGSEVLAPVLSGECLILGGCGLELYRSPSGVCVDCKSQCDARSANVHRQCTWSGELIVAHPTARCLILGGAGATLYDATGIKCDCIDECAARAVSNPARTCRWGSEVLP